MKKPTHLATALGTLAAVHYVFSPYLSAGAGDLPQDPPKASLSITASSTASQSGPSWRVTFDAVSDNEIVVLPDASKAWSITAKST